MMFKQRKLTFLFGACLFFGFIFLSFSSSVFATPSYTYTGSSTLINDGSANYRLKFLTSGTFTPGKNMTIDIFLVGGGGGGSLAGGGGGYTKTILNKQISAGTALSVTVGAGGATGSSGGCDPCNSGGNGGTSSGFGYSASGGYGAASDGGWGYTGGRGGSGGGGYGCGAGGTNGGNGAGGNYGTGGLGQGTTTREFGKSSGTLYSSGGAGGYNCGSDGTANTGTGGAGVRAGGSGIVVIRFNDDTTAPTCGTWSPSTSPWKTTAATQTFTLSGSTDTGGSGISTAGGSCTTGSTNGATCTVTISDVAGNTRVCTSPVNRVDTTAPTCGTWSPSTSPWKTTAATQTFTLSGSTDTGGSEINVAGGSCTAGSNNGDICTINISDNAGNSTICTSPINKVDSTPPTINSITADQELATASGGNVNLTVSGLADTGGSGLASLKYSYFVPGSSSWTQVTVANTNASASFDIPITKEGTYYVKAVVLDAASNLSNEVETSIFINRGIFTSSSSPSPVPSFTKPLQIKDIVKGSYVSFNNYLFVKLGSIGETGPFLAVSPMCEQPLILTSSGILDNTNTLYTGHLPTPGQTTIAIVSSPNSSMHGTCTWSSTSNPSLSTITSYLDSNHCVANINTSTTTTYTVSMTGCLTNPTTSLTVSLAEFTGE